jgi:hypothetical protein
MLALAILAAGAPGQPSPQQIIDRAIQAQGGADLLRKYPAMTMKSRGKFFAGDKAIPTTQEWTAEGNDRLKSILETTINGRPLKLIEVINGNRGWLKIGDMETLPLKKDRLQEERAEMYAGWVGTRLPLREDKGFKLTSLGEVQVDGQPALGVKVEREGQRDVRLYFDRKSGLLVKSSFLIRDLDAKGKEMVQDTFFHDYKAFQGLQQATRTVITRDGKRYIEVEATEVRPLEHLEDSTFARP